MDTPSFPASRRRREQTVIPANVAAEFERVAFQSIASGRRRLSAKAIIEVMRWNAGIEQANSPFKIDNNLAPQLARWFARRHPRHAALFEMRQVKERK